jgi:acetyl esterase/lipase
MTAWQRIPFVCISITLAVLAPCARAATKLDLDRVTPVPATEPIPVQDFFRPPLFSDPKLNSSGTHFAALVDTEDHTAMLVYDLTKKRLTVINGSKSKDVDSIAWLDQTHLLSSVLSEKLYAEGLFITDVTDLRESYPVLDYSATSLVGVPVKTPLRPLVWIYRNAYDDGNDMGVVQIDTSKRLGRNRDSQPGSIQETEEREEESTYGTRASIVETYPMPKGGGLVVDYLADKDGQLAFATTADRGVYSLFRLEGGHWVKCPVDLDQIDLVASGDRPNELIVIGPRQEGKPRALLRMDATTGALGEILVQDKAYDISGCSVYRHPVSKIILGVHMNRSLHQTIWFDENYATVQKLLTSNFPGQVIGILGSDQAESRFFVYAYSDLQPVSYYSLDLKAKSLGLIKSSAPWIDKGRMRPMSIVKVKTRDGHQIETYLTLPAGASKANPVPLVVLPHGGPWVRDVWGFDGEVQFLANRGYAVLQPNYRGSPGYDWMFPTDDGWAFRKMHDDVTDSVKTMIKSGLVDPNRIAIMGTSFGGYLAVCGAAFEPDLYRCAITVSGIFDWEQVLKEKKSVQYDSAAYGIFLRNLGNPKTNREQFDQISPLRHIEQVKIPIFVAHGKEDDVADVAESKVLISQLEKHHVSYKSMLVSAEGHGMSYTKDQVELYSRIEAFLAENLARAKSATVAASDPSKN